MKQTYTKKKCCVSDKFNWTSCIIWHLYLESKSRRGGNSSTPAPAGQDPARQVRSLGTLLALSVVPSAPQCGGWSAAASRNKLLRSRAPVPASIQLKEMQWTLPPLSQPAPEPKTHTFHPPQFPESIPTSDNSRSPSDLERMSSPHLFGWLHQITRCFHHRVLSLMKDSLQGIQFEVPRSLGEGGAEIRLCYYMVLNRSQNC